MKKFALLAFAVASLLLFAVSANALTEKESVEQTIQNYFDATQREDVDAYKNVMLIEGTWEDTRVVIEKMWELFDTRGVKLSNFETRVSGEKATSVFDVQGVVVDAETKEEYPIDATYVAILQKQGGKWLVELAMPIDEFTTGVKDILEMAVTNTEQTHARQEEELKEKLEKLRQNVAPTIPGELPDLPDIDFNGFGGNSLWIALAAIALAVVVGLYLVKKILFNKIVLVIVAVILIALFLGGFALLGGTGDGNGDGGTGEGGSGGSASPKPTIDSHAQYAATTPTATSQVNVQEELAKTREATQAYQEYIAAYNEFTDLMSRGLGDTAEAQQAYAKYKAAKEKYELIAQSIK